MKQLFNHFTRFLSLVAAFFVVSCNFASNDATNNVLAAKVKRGDYLVNAVANCMHCHADRDFTKFGGPPVLERKGKVDSEKAY